jgi:hypothetical protein
MSFSSLLLLTLFLYRPLSRRSSLFLINVLQTFGYINFDTPIEIQSQFLHLTHDSLLISWAIIHIQGGVSCTILPTVPYYLDISYVYELSQCITNNMCFYSILVPIFLLHYAFSHSCCVINSTYSCLLSRCAFTRINTYSCVEYTNS